MIEFCHLHLHSHYSLLDGANRIEDVVARAAELNMPAVALTDHGNLFGAVQFHDAAVEQGLKPIIGCEVYLARQGRKHREGRSAGANHLVLLAADDQGYANLVRLVSLGYLEGFYYKPRIDKELLAQHSQGLICLSACLQGPVAAPLTQDRYEEALREAAELAEIMGPGNFYLEVQDHHIAEQKLVNEGLVRMAGELGLPLVATNDCHYLFREDADAHDLLLCIQTGKTRDDPNRLVYRTPEFYLKTPEEMSELFRDLPEALRNTLEIAERCNFHLPKGQNIFPDFAVPAGHTVDSYFEKVVRDGFQVRLEELRRRRSQGRLRRGLEEYAERLEGEIKVIQQLHFSSYFLIVADFIHYAKKNGIPVGPGRGSAAGSLVSYAMGITDIDPLQYDLLFERFLNPERISPPDIDVDFCMLRRGEVIDYVIQRYGRDNVSHIITFGTMAARATVRDVGRSMNIPYPEVDKIAKLVPPNMNLKRAMEEVKELREVADSHPRYRDLLTVGQRLEGLARHASTHAAGIVIAPKPLIELVPLYRSNKDEISTQYSMKDLERLGLLKMDFLGLTTLTVIHQAVEQIRRQLNQEVDLNEIPLDDPQTFELFCAARTAGIFQFESAGMRDILRRLRPSRFEDLIALNALYRPGPIMGGMVDDFIERRHGRIPVTYELPELQDILDETYGVILYQEQVMQIANRLAGFSLAEADTLRRAMGKKKREVMQSLQKDFVDRAGNRGIPRDKALKVWQQMEHFAGYGFNKSHSAAYAYLAFQTAYLKAHYPVQFMAALLSSEMSNTDKLVEYLAEAREMGLEVLPPDINQSEVEFTGAGEKQIRFGLAAVKNVGEGAIRSILERRRELGNFRDFYHLCEEVDLRLLNRRALESLIKAGALDGFHSKRKSMMDALDQALETAQRRQRERAGGQRSLFGDLIEDEETRRELPDTGEWSDREKWNYEKEVLGFFLTGHPLEQFRNELKTFATCTTSELGPEWVGRDVAVGGVVAGYRRTQTRRGESMAVLVLEDLCGTVEVVLWPQVYEQHRNLLDSDGPLLVRGRCDEDARGGIKILCSELYPLATAWQQAVKRARIRIPLSRVEESRLSQFEFVLRRFPGRCPVEFELLTDNGTRVNVVPLDPVEINPQPTFIQEVESLFGESSCILETVA
jgi:DNA polymerase-3 subunit alpha